jgi:hypothetical protein
MTLDGSAESVAGKPGVVITRIPGGERAGEIMVRIRGGTEAFLAYAGECIERGETVLVFNDRGHRQVDVIRSLGDP